MRALALGHLVPARPEDRGSLSHHSEKKGLLLGPFEHPRSRRPRFPQPTEGRPEGEAEKVSGVQERGKRHRRTAALRRPKRAHEGLRSRKNARLPPGTEKEL